MANTIQSRLPFLQVENGKLEYAPNGGPRRMIRAIALSAPSGFGIELLLLDDYWWWREQRHAYLATQDRTPSQTFHFSGTTERVVALVAWMSAEFAAAVYNSESGTRSMLAAQELATGLAYLGGQVRTTRDPQLRDDLVRYLDSLGGH